MKTTFSNLLLLAAVTTALMFTGEIALRLAGVSYPIWYQSDRNVGVALAPLAEGLQQNEGRAYIKINSAGMRDGEHSKTKPGGTYRIAVLGDSYAEAVELPMEQTFWSVMGKRLSGCGAFKGREVEILNFGVAGYGTAQELIVLRNRVWEYSPDLVLLAFTTGNDVRDNSRELDNDPTVPYFTLVDGKLTLDSSFLASRGFELRETLERFGFIGAINHSRLLQLANRTRYRAKEREAIANARATYGVLGLDSAIYLPPPDKLWSSAWSVTEELLRTMDSEIRSRGAKFLVVTLTNPDQVHPDPGYRERRLQELGATDFAYADRRIAAFGAETGFPVLNLATPLLAFTERTGIATHLSDGKGGFGHWSPDGHREAGTLIAENICSGSVVPVP